MKRNKYETPEIVVNRFDVNTRTMVDIIDGDVDERTGVREMTAEEFASGSVAYLLQQGQTADEDGNIPEIWGQEIGVDKYPVIG